MRVGLVGASYAAGTHLPAYQMLEEKGIAKVVAVATSHRDSAEAVAARFGVPRAYAGYEALCQDPDVELVDVATRPSRHLPMVLSALAAGKHVLCEAPLAVSAADGQQLVDAAAAAGRLGWVDMQSRFWPGLQQLRDLVRDGWLGRVDNVAATAFYPTFTQSAAVGSSSWCARAENGASSLRVHGLHTADLLRWIFGELSEVSGVTARRAPQWRGPDGPVPADSVDSAAFTALTADGAVCSVHTSWVARFGAGWRLVVHGNEGLLVAEAAGHTGHFPVRLAGARGADTGLREIVPPSGTPTAPFIDLISALATRIAPDGAPLAVSGAGARASVSADDLPTFADGVAVLRIADEIERAG